MAEITQPQQPVKMRIGDRLVQAGLITNEQLMQALGVQKTLTVRKKIIRVLADLGFIDEDKLMEFFAEQGRLGNLNLDSIIEDFPANEDEILKKLSGALKLEFIDLENIDIDSKIATSVPFAQLKKFLAIPINESEFNILVAFRDPLDFNAQELIQRSFKRKPIKVVVAKREQILKYLTKLETNLSVLDLVVKIRQEISLNTNTENIGKSTSILKLIEVILKSAITSRASDIHIEPTINGCIVRHRIDGLLQESFSFDEDIFPPLSSRIKLLASLDIAEKRKPQDGRFSAKIANKDFDFRISTLPTLLGESIVIRILDKSKIMIKLEDLGLSESTFKRLKKAMSSPHGMIFVTGPTGSGKTTTLYAALSAIKSVSKKILTVEDPVEYQLPMVQQIGVNEKVGLTFATVLRSILRQDPDIIMIGEVRDTETLRIAIQAALTGHLVFSTLHTNDAISAITRLLDMGIESYFVSSSVVAIQAQRLIRRLCVHCKKPTDLADNVYEEIKDYIPKEHQFYKAIGCDKCSNTGYFGRDMVTEILLINDKISHYIAQRADITLIKEEAFRDGFKTMFEDGVLKASKGITTMEEVYRVTKL